MNSAIRWFTRNSVAANLLMLVILLSGIMALTKIPIEAFPRFETNTVSIQVPYRGGSPAEVEESIVVRIEEAIQDLEGIKEMTSVATEGNGTVTVEVADGYQPRTLMEDIKSRVDAINTFPEETERPIVSEARWQRDAISVIVAGDLAERDLKGLGNWVRDDIASLPGITRVLLTSVRPYEVSVEVPEKTLQRYGLTLDTIAQAIRRSSLDLPAGVVKTEGGEVLLRTKGQAYVKEDFERIVILTRDDGTRLTIADIATVNDGFEEQPTIAFYNGKRCVMIEVYRVGNQSIIDIAERAKAYIDKTQDKMPPGVELTYWRDGSKSIRLRLSSLMASAVQGMILIFIVLTLFLRLSVAIWVSVGIPVAIMGGFAMMLWLGVTINYISTFAFIMVLGLVVDDAIVTGENIYSRMKKGKDANGTQAAIKGTQEVAVPVTFGMLTTVIAFLAIMLQTDGPISRILGIVPMVVIPVLLASFIESKFILPTHLKHMRVNTPGGNIFTRLQQAVANGLETAIQRFYTPMLSAAVRQRYLSLSIFIGIGIILISLILGGWISFTFFPKVQSDVARASLTMPAGTPFEVTRQHVQHMTHAARQLQAKYNVPDSDESIITGIYSTVGSTRGNQASQPHLGLVMFELVPAELRADNLTSVDLVDEWRGLIGPIPGAEQMSFVGHIRHGGLPLDIELRGQDFDVLSRLADEVKIYLRGYPGVFDIADNFELGKEEIQLSIKPEAELLGLTLSDLARQVRQAFFGQEAQRIQRGRDDVRIMVRYPPQQRRSLASLESMMIRTASGVEVPFSAVAEAEIGRSFSDIRRRDRFRILNVTADLDKKAVNAELLKRDLTVFLDDLVRTQPGVQYALRGEAQEQQDSFAGAVSGVLLTLAAIYAMLAIPFRSYIQPLIVMTVIPFGILGAIVGHLMLGMDLSINSLMGMIALIGVVVNDSLVLVDFINRRRREGLDPLAAILIAGSTRFRPILLTSLTTFAGLLPLMFEQNVQAQFLIPMAVSLGYGILFATFITLLLVPINYMILEDIRGLFVKRELDVGTKPYKQSV